MGTRYESQAHETKAACESQNDDEKKKDVFKKTLVELVSFD